MHRPRRNNPDQPAITAKREANVKQSPDVSVSESMQPNFVDAVVDIFDDHQRIIEEDLLGLRLAHIMLVGALAPIAIIPVKPFDPQQVKHRVYYHNIHG